MFQFNPKRYRWFDWSEEDRETEQWLTSQHAEDIRKGDKVAIWASDPRAGVYAIGEIVMNPRKEPLAPEQRKYWRIKEDVYKFLVKKSVIVKYLRIITDKPLLKYECEKDSILSDMSVLKGRQATNLRLTKRQWNRILELIEQKRQSTE